MSGWNVVSVKSSLIKFQIPSCLTAMQDFTIRKNSVFFFLLNFQGLLFDLFFNGYALSRSCRPADHDIWHVREERKFLYSRQHNVPHTVTKAPLLWCPGWTFQDCLTQIRPRWIVYHVILKGRWCAQVFLRECWATLLARNTTTHGRSTIISCLFLVKCSNKWTIPEFTEPFYWKGPCQSFGNLYSFLGEIKPQLPELLWICVNWTQLFQNGLTLIHD